MRKDKRRPEGVLQPTGGKASLPREQTRRRRPGIPPHPQTCPLTLAKHRGGPFFPLTSNTMSSFILPTDNTAFHFPNITHSSETHVPAGSAAPILCLGLTGADTEIVSSSVPYVPAANIQLQLYSVGLGPPLPSQLLSLLTPYVVQGPGTTETSHNCFTPHFASTMCLLGNL